MRRVVVWDVGSTLVCRSMAEEEFVGRCLTSAGVPADSLDPSAVRAARELHRRLESQWRTAADEEAGRLEIAAALLQGSGATEVQIRDFAKALVNYFEIFALVPGIRRLLDELEERGLVQGVVSNWPPSLRRFLDFYDLTRYFKVVVGSGEFGAEKPDPAIFRHALERLGAAPSECVYVGDNPEKDIAPARQLGMEAIHFDPCGRWASADTRDVEQLRARMWQVLEL